jgi:hypothetical protein
MSESSYGSGKNLERAAIGDEPRGLAPIDRSGPVDPGHADYLDPIHPSLIPTQRPLILGACPSEEQETKRPFSGKSGRQITNLLPEAFHLDSLDQIFDLAYLIPQYSTDRFNRHKARVGVANLIRAGQIRPGRLVVAMGSNVVKTTCASGQQPHGLFHARQVQAPSLHLKVQARAGARSWGMMAGEFWLVSFPTPPQLRSQARLVREALACLVAGDYLALEQGTGCTRCRSEPRL